MDYEVTFIILAIAALTVGTIATYGYALDIITAVSLTAVVFVVWHLHHNTAQDLSIQKMEMHEQRKLIKTLSAEAKWTRNKLEQQIAHCEQTHQLTQAEHAHLLETLRSQRDTARAESTTARRLLRRGPIASTSFKGSKKEPPMERAALLTDFVSRALAVTIAVTASSLNSSATPAAATAQSASADIAVAAESSSSAAPSPSAASACTLSPLLPKSTAPAPTIASNHAQIGNPHSDKSIPVCQIAGPSTVKAAQSLKSASPLSAKSTVSATKPSLPPTLPPSPKLVESPAATSNRPVTPVKMPQAAEVHDPISQESVASVPPAVPSLPVPTLASPSSTVKQGQSSKFASPLSAKSTGSTTKTSPSPKSAHPGSATSSQPMSASVSVATLPPSSKPVETPAARSNPASPVQMPEARQVPAAVPSLPVPTPASPDSTTVSPPCVDANDHAAEEVAVVINQPLAAEEPTPVIVLVPFPVPSVSTAATKHHSAAHGLAAPVDAKAPVQPVGFQPIQRKRSYVVTKSPTIKRADQGLQEAKLNRQQLMPKRRKVEEQPKATSVPKEPKEKCAEVETIVEQPAMEGKPLRRRKARIARLDDKSKMHIVEWVVKIRSGLNRAVNPVKKYRDIGAYFARTGNLSIDKIEADYRVFKHKHARNKQTHCLKRTHIKTRKDGAYPATKPESHSRKVEPRETGSPHLPFDERGDELEVVHSDTAAFIRDAVKEELDLMLENRNVLAKLDALDDLLANNCRLPEDLMRGRVMVLKRVKKAQLLREAELMDTENQAETVEFRDIATTTASLKSQVIAHISTETS
ncbi:hypothetical protein BJ741DRAFT_578635 [Chytriomyces cf. hyalinus JEL632]|nr:hypothetical protein BJ741DRAFT_578635 [Chytriomyces cf. hyalinus JEL632]